MKRIILIYVCILMSGLVQAQEKIRQANLKRLGKLDSISRPTEVEALVESLDKRYASFRVNSTLTFEDQNCFRLADLNTIKPIASADFDKNGYTDLLVIGKRGKIPTIITLMGWSDNKVSLHLITIGRSMRCSIAKVITEEDNTLIEYRFFTGSWVSADSAKLVFKFGDFVEYMENPVILTT